METRSTSASLWRERGELAIVFILLIFLIIIIVPFFLHHDNQGRPQKDEGGRRRGGGGGREKGRRGRGRGREVLWPESTDHDKNHHDIHQIITKNTLTMISQHHWQRDHWSGDKCPSGGGSFQASRHAANLQMSWWGDHDFDDHGCNDHNQYVC